MAGVFEIPSGSMVPMQLPINVAQFVVGVAIGPSGTLDVSGEANDGSSTQVDEFKPPYNGAPFLSINTGSNALPYYLTAPGDFLFVPLLDRNQVNVYHGQSTMPFATITNGLTEPAASPFHRAHRRRLDTAFLSVAKSGLRRGLESGLNPYAVATD